jgi:hypothetical protein
MNSVVLSNPNELKPIPYSTRLVKMDRVGFEPTTSAMPRLTRARRSKVIDIIQPGGQIFSPLQIVIVVNLDFNHKVIESIFHTPHF